MIENIQKWDNLFSFSFSHVGETSLKYPVIIIIQAIWLIIILGSILKHKNRTSQGKFHFFSFGVELIYPTITCKREFCFTSVDFECKD